MRIERDQRVFIEVPEDAPDWLREQMPPTGSSGKADYVTRQAVWVRWGGGREGWVPRAWLTDSSILTR